MEKLLVSSKPNNLVVSFKIVWEKTEIFVHQSKQVIEVFDLNFS